MTISAVTPYNNKKRKNVDALINMSDKDIQTLAYIRTQKNVNMKKNRKVSNLLFYSAAPAAGLAAATLCENRPSKIFNATLTGLGARASRGLKTTALWVATLGALDLMSYAYSKLRQKSKTVNDFNRQHPFLSFGTVFALGLGVISLVKKGASGLGKLKAPNFMKKAAEKAGEFLNNNKTITRAKNALISIKDKTHPSIKDITETGLYYLPCGLLLGGLFNSVRGSNKVAREFSNNYLELKNKQSKVAQSRVLELSLQNDFLMQDPKNRESVELLEEPLEGILD